MEMQRVFANLGGIRPVGGRESTAMPEAAIAAFEDELGVRLPKAYRTFLATYGAIAFRGASPDNPYVVFCPLTPLPPHITRTGRAMFDAFYGGEEDAHDTYGLRVQARFFASRIPDPLIPIGDDGGSGQICLGIKGAEAGKVYYWDQRNEPLDEETYLEDYGKPRPPEAMFQNVYLIAESFEDFLRRLELRPA